MSKPRKDRRSYSPTLIVKITEEQYETARRADSGGCLIADAIKRDYPNLSGVVVDMATVRATDKERGCRYTYLTPSSAQHCLLAWDQGWPNPSEELRIKAAVKITPITRPMNGPQSAGEVQARRVERIAVLESKQESGEPLTRPEKAALTRMRNPKPAPERPTSKGPVEIHGELRSKPVVVGGKPIPQGKPHPNLLRGRNRLFGAKVAQPSIAFQEALEAALAERAQLSISEA